MTTKLLTFLEKVQNSIYFFYRLQYWHPYNLNRAVHIPGIPKYPKTRYWDSLEPIEPKDHITTTVYVKSVYSLYFPLHKRFFTIKNLIKKKRGIMILITILLIIHSKPFVDSSTASSAIIIMLFL